MSRFTRPGIQAGVAYPMCRCRCTKQLCVSNNSPQLTLLDLTHASCARQCGGNRPGCWAVLQINAPLAPSSTHIDSLPGCWMARRVESGDHSALPVKGTPVVLGHAVQSDIDPLLKEKMAHSVWSGFSGWACLQRQATNCLPLGAHLICMAIVFLTSSSSAPLATSYTCRGPPTTRLERHSAISATRSPFGDGWACTLKDALCDCKINS